MVPFLLLPSYLLNNNDLLDVICNIAIYTDGITLYSKCNPASDLWQQLKLAAELESDVRDTGAGRGILISMLEKLNLFCLTSLITLVLLLWKWMGLFLRKNHLSLLNYFFINSIAKAASKKIGVLIRSMKFIFPEIALDLCKSAIQPSLEYWCHAQVGAANYYSLEMLDKLQKRICRAAGPSFATSLEPLAHFQNVASLVFPIGITLDVQLIWFDWILFLITKGGLLIILIDNMILLSPILHVIRMSMSTVSFLAQIDSETLCLKDLFLWSMI